MGLVKSLGVTVHQVLIHITKWPAFIAAILLPISVVAGIIARYVFNRPLHFVDEYTGYMNVIMVILPLGYVLKNAELVRLNFVDQYLSRRVNDYLKLINGLVSLAITTILIISTTKMMAGSFATGARAYTFMLTPLWPVQLILPIGFGIFAITIAVDIVLRISKLISTRHGQYSKESG